MVTSYGKWKQIGTKLTNFACVTSFTLSIVNYFHSIDRTTHCGLPTSPDVLVLTEFVKLKFSNIPQRVFVIKHLFVKISPLWILTTLGPLHHFLLANNGRVTYLKDIKTNFAIFVVSSEKNLFEINSNSAEATSPPASGAIQLQREEAIIGIQKWMEKRKYGAIAEQKIHI